MPNQKVSNGLLRLVSNQYAPKLRGQFFLPLFLGQLEAHAQMHLKVARKLQNLGKVFGNPCLEQHSVQEEGLILEIK